MTIPVWLVTIMDYDDEAPPRFRVSDTDLDHFLRVLTFNKREFNVEREPDPAEQSQGKP